MSTPDDKAALKASAAQVLAKALVWRKQVLMPYTRAENDLRLAIDAYLADVGKYAGVDAGRIFQ